MQQSIRIRWRAAGAVALAAAVALAGCGDGGTGGDPGAGGAAPASPTGTHAGHGGTPPPSPAPLRGGERFVEPAMDRPYAPQAPNGGTDEYRCFMVDPKVTDPATYLTGSQFLPQNADLVHHAIFFRVDPGQAAQARALDAKTPGQGWRCFGGSGIDGDTWVAHWAPGANEVLLREGLGHPMPPGSLLVMQVHYNLLTSDGDAAGATDRSRIRLRLASGAAAAMTPLETYQLAAPVELPCTAQESGPLCDREAAVADVVHRFGDDAGSAVRQLNDGCNDGRAPRPGPSQRCDYPAPADITVYAAAGHMHLLGRAITVELNPGTARARTLLDVPAYDFDDQATRPLKNPVTVRRGDVLRVTCTHDAGLRRQLPQLRPLRPRYVVWGDGTSDEMCLGLLVGTATRR
jgi:hypothetical protein